jgi:hypothetical protein
MNKQNASHILKNISCVFLSTVLLIGFFFSTTQTVRAQGILTSDIGATIQQTLQTLSTAALEEKEIIWDGLFFDIAQQALQQMTNDMIEWVNGGMDGEPRFVTDLIGYLQDVADEVAGDVIYGDESSSICTPFQLNVRQTVAKEFKEQNHEGIKEKVACTAGDVPGGNQEAFLSGTFSAGGWSLWFETVLNPQNTPIGAKLKLQQGIAEETSKKQYAKEKDYEIGGGFPSTEVCTPVGTTGEKKCTITTPGSIIQDQVSFKLNIPALRLIQADEMNEVVGALFGDLANQAVSGVNGLLGLGGSSMSANSFGASGELSYLDAIKEERANAAGPTSATGNKIEQALRVETQVLELQLAIVTELEDITSEFLEVEEEYEDESCWDLEFPETLEEELDDLSEQVPKTVSSVITLDSMLRAYKKDTSTAGQLNILKQLTAMQSEGKISGRTAVIQYEYYLGTELPTLIDDLLEDIEDAEDAC